MNAPRTAAPPGDLDLSDLPPGYPRGLVSFMLSGWTPGKTKGIRQIPEAADHARRRATLAALFPGDVLIVPSGRAPVRSNDTHHPFRPGSDLLYLTGCDEPDVVLVIDAAGEATLYVEGVVGREHHGFFTDRHRGALWVGPRLGLEATTRRYGLRCASLDTLADNLGDPTRRRVLRGLDPGVDEMAGPPDARDTALGAALGRMRLIKDAGEIRAMRAAIRSTQRAFEDVIRGLPTARGERDVEITFTARARREGHGPGYGVIAAAGDHATILHWHNNDGPLHPDGLLLLDAGVEGKRYYTADITRTLPVSGRFSAVQAQIYDLVEAGWRAAVAAVKPGAAFVAPYAASSAVIVAGLHRMGILNDVAAALHPDTLHHRRYTLHTISHMVGLDVHDCDRAPAIDYKLGRLVPGMVLTIEPGLYFQRDDRTVPPAFRGLGVRIEDDVLVTESGAEVLSASIPRRRAAVERWMARLWRS